MYNDFFASPHKSMQNHFEIMSKNPFWIRNVRNLAKSLSLDMSSGCPGVQDLSSGCPGVQDLSSGCPERQSPCQRGRLLSVFSSQKQYLSLLISKSLIFH